MLNQTLVKKDLYAPVMWVTKKKVLWEWHLGKNDLDPEDVCLEAAVPKQPQTSSIGWYVSANLELIMLNWFSFLVKAYLQGWFHIKLASSR
jgi:hypothetical protein